MKLGRGGFFGCLITSFLYSAETKIQLIQTRSLRDIDGKVGIVIVGKHEQLKQLGCSEYDIATGRLWGCDSNAIYRRKEDSNIVWRTIMNLSRVIYVTEPCLGQEAYWYEEKSQYVNHYVYETRRTKSRCPELSAIFEFHGNDALEEAKKDLALCYNTVLTYFAQNNDSARQIAFLPIGMGNGFPWEDVVKIGVDSISDYIEKRPKDYERIWLCVMGTDGDGHCTQSYRYYEQLLVERQNKSMCENDMEKKFVNNYFLN